MCTEANLIRTKTQGYISQNKISKNKKEETRKDWTSVSAITKHANYVASNNHTVIHTII